MATSIDARNRGGSFARSLLNAFVVALGLIAYGGSPDGAGNRARWVTALAIVSATLLMTIEANVAISRRGGAGHDGALRLPRRLASPDRVRAKRSGAKRA